MTTQQKPSRANIVRKRRSSETRSKPTSQSQGTGSKKTTRTSRQSYRSDSIILPVKPRTGVVTARRLTNSGALRKTQGNTLRQAFVSSSPTNTRRSDTRAKGSPSRQTRKDAHNKGYDFAFSLGRTAVRAPLISLPNLGTRWVSAGLTLVLGLLIYTMTTANTFKVSAIEVSGNQRLTSEDVNGQLGLAGQLVFQVLPSQVGDQLRTAFPDLAAVSVHLGVCA